MSMDPVLLEEMLKKIGGKYRMVSLYQKRLRELLRGLPPLVEISGEVDFREVVAREILAGKVEILLGEDAESLRKELAAKEEENLLLSGKGKQDAKKGGAGTESKPVAAPVPTATDSKVGTS